MSWVIFALLLAFVAGNVYGEGINEGANDGMIRHWWIDPLSSYLSHVVHWQITQGAYYGLALGLILLALQSHGWLPVTLLAVSAAGLVVLTAVRLPQVPRTRLLNRVHVGCAGLAFVAMLIYELVTLWHQSAVWLPIAGIAACVAFARWAPSRSALEEKAFTACLLAGLIAIAAPAL